MTRFSYIFLISFLLIFLELLLESLGLRLMLFAPFVFYISYVFGAGAGCAAALIGGMTLDFCLGHTHPRSAVFLLAVVLFGRLWLRRMGSDSLNLLVIPGAVLPFLAQFPPTLIQSGLTLDSFVDSLSNAIVMSLLSAFLFPMAILLLDYLASLLSLELYSDARERMRNRIG